MNTRSWKIILFFALLIGTVIVHKYAIESWEAMQRDNEDRPYQCELLEKHTELTGKSKDNVNYIFNVQVEGHGKHAIEVDRDSYYNLVKGDRPVFNLNNRDLGIHTGNGFGPLWLTAMIAIDFVIFMGLCIMGPIGLLRYFFSFT